jgi:hypothetical protein
MSTADGILEVARELADEVLFHDAMRVDRLDVLPVVHLDALAAAGLYDEHAQRLAREAMFLLVFGSRPDIKSALLQRLGAAAQAGA